MNRYEKELLKQQVNRGNSVVLVVIHNYTLYDPYEQYDFENKKKHENDACMSDISIKDIISLDDREYIEPGDCTDGLEMIEMFIGLMDEHFDEYQNDIIRMLPNSKRIRDNIDLIDACGKKEYIMGQFRKQIRKELRLDE